MPPPPPISTKVARPDPTVIQLGGDRTHQCFNLREAGGVWYVAPLGTPLYRQRTAPDGTVVGCPQCSKTWVAKRLHIGLVAPHWRREGRVERWLRRRRQARR